MTPQTTQQQPERIAREPLVISRTDEGFRVYAPSDPAKSYIVGGGPDAPTCTCPDFQYHEGDPRWRCKHILAVLAQYEGAAGTYDAGERAAIQAEGRPEDAHYPATPNGGAEMVIKRSISPDGRIDSLSVEFSCPINGGTVGDIKTQALKTMQIQDEIVARFLNRHGNGNGAQPPAAQNGNDAMPAQMLGISGITTKWGRRLYIGVQANGQTLKFFGSRKQLADAIVAAGYPRMAERLDEGTLLNLPCRVITKPSEDGRYMNVGQILPAEARPPRRSW